MNKKYYIVLILVLVLSVVLFGFSYSKESGEDSILNINNEEINEFKITYQDTNKIKLNEETNILITNESKDKINYQISLEEISDKKFIDVYYVIDNNKEQKLDKVIYIGELNSYGEDGDLNKHSIRIYSKTQKDLEFNIVVTKKEPTPKLKNYIIEDANIYKDENNNYYYYGEYVNNYIKYNGSIYQIIGCINGKIKLISSITGLGIYNNEIQEYATLDDYLKTINNPNFQYDDPSFTSWMTGYNGYWLKDTSENDMVYVASRINGLLQSTKTVSYYQRHVIYLDENVNYINGTGTYENPYEFEVQ